MDKPRSFKQAADRFMEPLDVTPELKSKTLRLAMERNKNKNRNEKNRIQIRFLKSAAIGAAMLACFGLGLLWNSMPRNTAEPASVEESHEISPGRQEHIPESFPATAQGAGSWQMPDDVPDGYRVQSISVSSEDGFEVTEVRYEAKVGAFTLTRSDKPLEPQQDGEQEIDLHGARAKVRTMPDGSVELRWKVQAYTYTLQGNLTQEAAVRIADSSLR